ncbi:cytochrome P450 [Multifurca ochricompacta]|uniref:Cytochrome P450 n=1 Tax=Multifurca ochricompacta TaxID=376703 RepID=A0AAD4LVN5_9AGAM|nr:cytochrome P450 [Multifurca ochricompacta]
MREQVGSYDLKWQDSYGMVARIWAPCNDDRLWISDPKALQYILQTSRYNMVKPYAARFLLNSATGPGVNGAEGEDHYRQRRILLPAFGPSESRAQIPVFRQCASELVDEFKSKMESQGSTSQETNIPHFLTYAILNALGLAAFNYNFRGHGKDREEFTASLRDFMVKGFGLPSNGKVFFQGIMDHLPTWMLDLMVNLPSSGLTFLRRHVELSNGIAQQLIQSRLTEEDDGNQKDALSRIVIANRSESERWRLSDKELFPQLATILGAGHETTVTSLGWILFELANHPDEQWQLREEILAARAGENGDDSKMVNLDALPFMNAVIKETLRFDTVVPHLFREAIRDEVVPLSKPIRCKSGKVIDELFIPKGTSIIISDVAYNRNKELWGEDADVWRPSRWLDGTVKNTGFNVGVMSFGAGHRACLGWRFAVTEIQSFMFELLWGLQFELTEKSTRVRKENCLVMLPMVGGEEEKGNQLPLKVSLIDLPK